jgi:hypothetical protein
MVKLPSSAVAVLTGVPFTCTVAPATGLFVEEITLPEIFLFCAKPQIERDKTKSTNRTFVLSIAINLAIYRSMNMKSKFE